MFKPKIKLSEVDEMLRDLSGNDLTKIPALRKVKMKTLYDTYYLNQVASLNEMIEHVEYLKYLESKDA